MNSGKKCYQGVRGLDTIQSKSWLGSHLYFPTLVIFGGDISRIKVSYYLDHVAQSLVKYSFLAANTQVIIYKSETNYFELRFSAWSSVKRNQIEQIPDYLKFNNHQTNSGKHFFDSVVPLTLIVPYNLESDLVNPVGSVR